VLLDPDHHVQVARGPARAARLAFAADAQLAAVSTPPGILIWSLRSTVTWPSPPQSLQGVATMRPVPWQRPQVRATLKNPCWNVTWPRPPQDAQVVGEVPGAAPLPWQVAHGSARGIWMWVSVPKTASSKPRSRL
jgi:hypothetical protein